MRLLALDQASRTSGYAIFENGKLIDYGHFTAISDELGERLFWIREKIAQLIADYGIDYVAFEDIQLHTDATSITTFKILAEVFGVVYELCSELELPSQVVFSGTWKHVCGIKGKKRAEQKANAQAYVLNTYGIKATQDESDAICLGTCAWENLNKKPDFDWSD